MDVYWLISNKGEFFLSKISNMNTKKILFGIIATFSFFACSGLASAESNVGFDSSKIESAVGQEVSVNVYIDSLGGDTNYTVKADLSFPKDQLFVKDFNFAGGWISINEPGYDLVDNTNGYIIKTAGFPGGWIGKKLLGVITFVPKTASVGKVAVGSSTFVLNEDGSNTFSNGGELIVNTVK